MCSRGRAARSPGDSELNSRARRRHPRLRDAFSARTERPFVSRLGRVFSPTIRLLPHLVRPSSGPLGARRPRWPRLGCFPSTARDGVWTSMSARFAPSQYCPSVAIRRCQTRIGASMEMTERGRSLRRGGRKPRAEGRDRPMGYLLCSFGICSRRDAAVARSSRSRPVRCRSSGT